MKGKSRHEVEGIEMLDGVMRRTLSYNEEVMLCHFQLHEGASIPLHNHRASQIGFMVKGAVRFLGEEETDSFVARAGDSYVLDPHQIHGAQALEASEFVEVFYPVREEYKDS